MYTKINQRLIKRHELDIGLFHFCKNFIVAEIKEGINLNFDSGKELFQLANTYYQGITPYVYISNRINSYSVKPTEHYKLENIFPNFKGYAIVTYDTVNYEVAKLEELFTNRPTGIFNTLNEAVDWAEDLIHMD